MGTIIKLGPTETGKDIFLDVSGILIMEKGYREGGGPTISMILSRSGTPISIKYNDIKVRDDNFEVLLKAWMSYNDKLHPTLGECIN